MHYKPTDSHRYYYIRHPTQHTSRTPSVTRSSLDCDVFVATTLISLKNEQEMCQFFKTRGHPDPVIHKSKHRAESVHLQTSTTIVTHKTRGKNRTHAHISPRQNFSQKHHLKKLQSYFSTTPPLPKFFRNHS